MDKLYITVLAGGMGKRMQSDTPKVLHLVKGKVMIVRLIKEIIKMDPVQILIVVGKFRDEIKNEIEKTINDNRITYVDQVNPLGTGDAVKSTLSYFNVSGKIHNIILNGDVPMIEYITIKEIYDHYLKNNSKLLITSIHLKNPSGNGRIIIDKSNCFKEIIEEKDCAPEQRLLTLVNCGIYVCDSEVLTYCIPKITNNNASGEYYLTDIVKIYSEMLGQKIDLFILAPEKEMEIFNINTKEQLHYLESIVF